MKHEFCDNCPDCRPILMNIETNETCIEDNPAVIRMNDVWKNHSTFEQRKSFMEVMVHDSKDPTDLRNAIQLMHLFSLESSVPEGFELTNIDMFVS